MIERHVYLRLKDRADRARVEERALAVLPTIPGVRDVLVNGVPVLRDGEHTGATPGRVVDGPGRSD